jgi:hypothetical protein
MPSQRMVVPCFLVLAPHRLLTRLLKVPAWDKTAEEAAKATSTLKLDGSLAPLN